jgi:hypothetical protein
MPDAKRALHLLASIAVVRWQPGSPLLASCPLRLEHSARDVPASVDCTDVLDPVLLAMYAFNVVAPDWRPAANNSLRLPEPLALGAGEVAA